MQFNDYRIPREYLLNRTGDVLEDGTYVTPYKVCKLSLLLRLDLCCTVQCL